MPAPVRRRLARPVPKRQRLEKNAVGEVCVSGAEPFAVAWANCTRRWQWSQTALCGLNGAAPRSRCRRSVGGTALLRDDPVCDERRNLQCERQIFLRTVGSRFWLTR